MRLIPGSRQRGQRLPAADRKTKSGWKPLPLCLRYDKFPEIPCPSISTPSIPTNSKPAEANCGGTFDYPKLQARLAELEGLMAEVDFWSNKERAQKNVEEVSTLRGKIGPL